MAYCTCFAWNEVAVSRERRGRCGEDGGTAKKEKPRK